MSNKSITFATKRITIKTKSMATTVSRKATSFRLRTDLLEGLKRNAAREKRTLNNYVESVLLELVYHEPNEVTKAVKCPTIGIGAGNGTDGQVLVIADMLGMTQGFSPRFLRRYADIGSVITDAVGRYVTDVKSGDFPNENESY